MRKLARKAVHRSYKSMHRWKRKGRRTILKDEWICLHADECELPNGTRLAPYYVLEEREWVHIVALNAHREVLLTRQYRYAAEIFTTELPSGYVEMGETPIQAAKRELLEETGHTSSNWTELPTLFANPARQTNKVHCFVAQDVSRSAMQTLDPGECSLTWEFASPAQVLKRIGSDDFCQSLHVASFLMALHRGGRFPTI